MSLDCHSNLRASALGVKPRILAIFMPNEAERKDVMNISQSASDENINALTLHELIEITLYTIQKINNYPKSLGKTVENYFHLLFPDEIKSYLIRRTVNEKSFGKTFAKDSSNEDMMAVMSTYAKQIKEIRSLCQLFVEHQNGILGLISDKLDEIETGLFVPNASEGGA